MSPQPDTQQVPIPRATTAACDVIPPRTVKIPCARFIPSISSGDVSSLAKIRSFSPALCILMTSSAVKHNLPVAAPGDAARPVAITLAAFRLSSSKFGCSN